MRTLLKEYPYELQTPVRGRNAAAIRCVCVFVSITATGGTGSALGGSGGYSAGATGGVVVLAPDRDNTLYEHPDSDVSNGAGQSFFSGMNSLGLRRRAALRFDVASALPVDAIVTGVELRLFASRSSGDPDEHSLHALTRSWGEGSSVASGQGGQGAPAEPGDATWVHAFFDNVAWSTPGGDFESAHDAAALVGDEGHQYTWSSAAMAQRVQSWLVDPASNYGWLLLGSEITPGVVNRFDSRENSIEQNRPALFIEYTVIPTPPTWAAPALLLLMGSRRRR